MRDMDLQAPWITETEATGYCSAENGAWWNNPPSDSYDEEDDFWEEGDDGDVYYGSETAGF